MPHKEEKLTTAQAAALLRCSRSRVKELVEEGEIEAERDGAGELTVLQRAVFECLVRELQSELGRRAGESAPGWLVVSLAFVGPGLANVLLLIALALLAP